MRCLSCKYDLSNLTERRCPECGRAFDPNNSATFDTTAKRTSRFLWNLFATVMVLLAMTFFAALIYMGLLDR